jgi:hypothetical protein
MKISSAFPSQYLKAADLNDRAVRVTIADVRMEDIGGDHKPILYFVGKEKGLVMNKTNANTISGRFGDDTDDWNGQDIELFPTIVDFQGRSVDAIRVRIPKGPARAAPPPRQYSEAEPPPPEDDIPF